MADKPGYCARNGCPALATHAIELAVPWLRGPIGRPPMEMTFGLYQCEIHAKQDESEGAAKWVAPAKDPEAKSMREIFEVIMANRGGADFDSAIIRAVPINSETVGIIERMGRKPN